MSILVKHFVNNPRIVLEIDKLSLSEEEKIRLTETIILLYHQKLLGKFLEYLEADDKKLLMHTLLQDSQSEAINLLREKIANIEEVVNDAIDELEEQILKDLENVKENK